MEITYIGLGKMGFNMVTRLLAHGHEVLAYDPSEEARKRAEEVGAKTATTLAELMEASQTPRTVWLMVPHQVVDDVLNEIKPSLKEGDTVIEGGNSPFQETMKRSKKFEDAGINFLDAGVSGGPGGAKDGACIMVGGKKEIYETYIPLFRDLSVEDGYAYVGRSGTGHFVKMIHNGIEYGMMQSLAEGFDILKHADFGEPLPLTDIARLYNHGSVIESRLTQWLEDGFKQHGEDLDAITGSANASGEGLWTVETAQKMDIPVAVIEESLNARVRSQEVPNYQGKIISVLRNQFGGHDASK